MREQFYQSHGLPPEQAAIRDKCFHPSGTFVEFPMEDIETSIPERFDKMVRFYPKQIAVATRSESLTYEALNHAANRVANALLALSDAQLEPVGLLLPKSVALVIAMLGTLKAGKTCVPMDPTFPATRLSRMCEDLQARLLVVDQSTVEVAKGCANKERFLNVDDLDNRADASPNVAFRPDDSACIFYTSGSTGLPKGVIENHRNLLYHTMRDTNDYHICAEDRLTFVASSGRDIFRALLNGAAVYPLDIRQEEFTGLAHWMMKEEITVLNCVTSVFRNFASAVNTSEQFPHLRLIGLTGETIYKSDFELFRNRFSDKCVLVNRYGPNEAGRIAQYLMDESTVFTSNVVPVGYLASGKEIQLVDNDGNPVAVGAIGEIVVRSRYLSPGYWRQPELTHDTFQADPLNPQNRVYHTGDLGLMEPDGRLLHLGRKDFQVKIRGNRVDTMAVETAILGLESVREAAVVAVESGAGDPHLVAYVVVNGTPVPTSSSVRDALKDQFPAFMIPSTFVFMDKLPVTGIGKVDRRALPAPDWGRPGLDVPYVAPRNEIEEKLADIWAEVLHLERVGVLDNFLHLGGHSITAVRVVTKIIQSMQIELPIKALFDSPTIADMAALIARNELSVADAQALEHMLNEVEAITEGEASKSLARGQKGERPR